MVRPTYEVMSLRSVYGWLGAAVVAAWLGAAPGASGQVAYIANYAGTGVAGATDGLARDASFNGPQQVAPLADGSLLIADRGGNRIRKLSASGMVSTVAGTGSASGIGINQPVGVAVAPDGKTFYFSENGGHQVLRVDPDGTVTRVAGIGIQGGGSDGVPAGSSRLNNPEGLATGPDGALYIADSNNSSVRRVAAGADRIVTPLQTITTVASGFGNPSSVLVDGDGSLVVTDTLRITRVGSDGTKTRLAGSAGSSYCQTAGALCGDGGPATSALLYGPRFPISDGHGGYLFSDSEPRRVRRISEAGIISTVAGTGVACSLGAMCGDGGSALAAQLSSPAGLFLAPDGSLYVADRNLHRIRRVSPLPSTAPGGPVGLAGPQGETGLKGPAGDDGSDGADGAAGANGVDGSDGANGRDGNPGRSGPDGLDGTDGAGGAPGVNGRDGTWNDLVAMKVLLPAEAIMSRPARRAWVRLFVSGASTVEVTLRRNGKVVKRVKRKFKRIGRKRFDMGRLGKGRYEVRVTAVAVTAGGGVSGSSVGRDSARLVVR